VLLTGATSRRINRLTAHPHSEVLLDGLVEQLDLSRGIATVRILLATGRALMPVCGEVHQLHRHDLLHGLGHPPTVWQPTAPHLSAVSRARQYGPPTDPWLQWKPEQWERQ